MTVHVELTRPNDSSSYDTNCLIRFFFFLPTASTSGKRALEHTIQHVTFGVEAGVKLGDGEDTISGRLGGKV